MGGGSSVVSFNGTSSKDGCWSVCGCGYPIAISSPSKATQNLTGDIPGGLAVLLPLIRSIKQDFKACKSSLLLLLNKVSLKFFTSIMAARFFRMNPSQYLNSSFASHNLAKTFVSTTFSQSRCLAAKCSQ